MPERVSCFFCHEGSSVICELYSSHTFFLVLIDFSAKLIFLVEFTICVIADAVILEFSRACVVIQLQLKAWPLIQLRCWCLVERLLVP